MKEWIKQWIKTYVAQEVPSDLATCEFECNNEHCTPKTWQNCPKRKIFDCSKKKSAGADLNEYSLSPQTEKMQKNLVSPPNPD